MLDAIHNHTQNIFEAIENRYLKDLALVTFFAAITRKTANLHRLKIKNKNKKIDTKTVNLFMDTQKKDARILLFFEVF